MTVTPKQVFSKTLNSSRIPEKNVYFWGDNVCFWGDNVYSWGNKVYSRGFSKILGIWNLFFCCRGVLGLYGSGGPVGVFEKRYFKSPGDPCSSTRIGFDKKKENHREKGQQPCPHVNQVSRKPSSCHRLAIGGYALEIVLYTTRPRSITLSIIFLVRPRPIFLEAPHGPMQLNPGPWPTIRQF